MLFLERTCWLAYHAKVLQGRSPVRAGKQKTIKIRAMKLDKWKSHFYII